MFVCLGGSSCDPYTNGEWERKCIAYLNWVWLNGRMSAWLTGVSDADILEEQGTLPPLPRGLILCILRYHGNIVSPRFH